MNTYKEIEKNENVVFDYTSFLSASCRQSHLSFTDALRAVLPSFEVLWKSSLPAGITDEEKLQQQALKVLSTNTSDTNNLIRLLRLARTERIMCLRITMPYALDYEQLEYITDKTDCAITFDDDCGEVLNIRINAPS
ncbi:hypothetical protein A3K86_03620 [Photobacterium jeanii]|uniref:Uncharacterized protein n=1 Tax=Photobacterium jeanii TaxID=858640 RepID=A0A178KL99_9GAMM|nr:hypothetical protein [Photobacterium jeanii]OAN18020.1 hypothetical protein A3K86_03620 [Photobacterium jeanii]PST92311.1 hypothetical protein C9I91_03820 [Photobacterium jeanii]